MKTGPDYLSQIASINKKQQNKYGISVHCSYRTGLKFPVNDSQFLFFFSLCGRKYRRPILLCFSLIVISDAHKNNVPLCVVSACELRLLNDHFHILYGCVLLFVCYYILIMVSD